MPTSNNLAEILLGQLSKSKHITYSSVLKSNRRGIDITSEPPKNTLSHLLNEFIAMLNQLSQPDSVVLNVLTALISKLLH